MSAFTLRIQMLPLWPSLSLLHEPSVLVVACADDHDPGSIYRFISCSCALPAVMCPFAASQCPLFPSVLSSPPTQPRFNFFERILFRY